MSRRISALLILAVLVPSVSSALPVVAGFGDSITCDTCNDGSYMGLLADYLEPDPILDDNGVSADRTSGVLSRLTTWLGDGNTADVLILLTGTPDVYQVTGGFGNQEYSEADTLLNVENMVDLVLGASIPLILVAPPPVLDPCGFPDAPLTCSTIDSRLAGLATEYALIASNKSVPFLDLYSAFMADPDFGLIADGGAHPGPDSLLRADGLHPQLATGDTLIASLLAPMIETALIPEPSTALLVGCGLLVLAHRRQGRRAA